MDGLRDAGFVQIRARDFFVLIFYAQVVGLNGFLIGAIIGALTLLAGGAMALFFGTFGPAGGQKFQRSLDSGFLLYKISVLILIESRFWRPFGEEDLMKKTLVLRTLLTGVCGLAMSAPAFAQAAAEETTDGSEIIVTAQNRQQNVNDVPIAINVVGAEAIRNAGFSSMNDISKIAPVVQLNQDQGTVKISIRGVGTTSNDEAQDTSVVVNVDGEYINRPQVMSVALFDIDRVEALRGPQGTLYGRNSTAGAINFITRKPGKEFGINASASYGNFDAIRLDAGVDLPLGESAGVRFAGFYDKHDGYVSHPAGGGFGPFPAFAAGRSDDNKSYGGRVSLQFNPGALTVNLSAEYANRKYTPQEFAAADLNGAGKGPTGPGCNASGFVRVAPNYSQTLCVPSGTNFLSGVNRASYAAPLFGLGKLGQDTWAIHGRISYEISDAATLTYIGGYRNFSGDPSNFSTLPIVYRSYNYAFEPRTQSHELRVNGKLGGTTYQVGSFYFKEKLYSESCFIIPVGANGSCLSYFGRRISSDSRSVFGQVEVPLGDKLTAVGGLRYTDNKRRAIYQNASPFGPGAPDPLLFGTGPARKTFSTLKFLSTLNLNPPKEDSVTWLAGLNYKPNADTLIYAKASKGFKAGGFDSVGPYRAETNTAFEAGLKLGFGDTGQHQFNLSAFHYNYKDLQVSVLLDTRIGGQTFNAGSARINGVEAEAMIALDDKTRFNASFNFLDAKYKTLLAQFNVFTVPGTGADLNGVGDLDPVAAGVQQPNFGGNRREFAPKFIITAGLDHDFAIGAGILTASVDTMLKSSYFTDFFNYRDGQQSAYTQTNASLTYKPENKRFSIQAFVRNIENTRPLTYGSFVSAGPDDIYNWQFGTPRTYGARVTLDF